MENKDKAGMREVFTPYIRTKDGRIVRPKNARFFHFYVPADTPERSQYQQLSLFDKEKQ